MVSNWGGVVPPRSGADLNARIPLAIAWNLPRPVRLRSLGQQAIEWDGELNVPLVLQLVEIGRMDGVPASEAKLGGPRPVDEVVEAEETVLRPAPKARGVPVGLMAAGALGREHEVLGVAGPLRLVHAKPVLPISRREGTRRSRRPRPFRISIRLS